MTAKTKLFLALAATGIIVIVAIAGVYLLDAARQECVTKEGYVFGTTEAYFDMASSCLKKGDTDSFKALAKGGVAGITKSGVKCYVVDRASDGKVKIRAFDKDIEIWTMKDAVDCD